MDVLHSKMISRSDVDITTANTLVTATLDTVINSRPGISDGDRGSNNLMYQAYALSVVPEMGHVGIVTIFPSLHPS